MTPSVCTSSDAANLLLTFASNPRISSADDATRRLATVVTPSPTDAAPGTVVRTVHDVLFGRGKCNSHWPGNVFFRKLIKDYREVYTHPTTRRGAKVKIAATIIRAIYDAGGRFIERQDYHRDTNDKNEDTSGSSTWVVVSYDRSIEKALQALREKPSAIKGNIVAASSPPPPAHQTSDSKMSQVDEKRAETTQLASSRRSIVCPTFFQQNANWTINSTWCQNKSPEEPTLTTGLLLPNRNAVPLSQATFHVATPGVSVVLSPQDVLLGNNAKNWPGNIVFRQLVNHHRQAYLHPSTKQAVKTEIAHMIIRAVHHTGGRFMRNHDRHRAAPASTGIVVTYDRAFEKTKRALRYEWKQGSYFASPVEGEERGKTNADETTVCPLSPDCNPQQHQHQQSPRFSCQPLLVY